MKVLFEYYKDKPIGNSKNFKQEIMKNYKITIEETTKLYTAIVNYQVEKYGCTLMSDVCINSLKTETLLKAKARRIGKRKNLKLRRVKQNV